MAESRLPTDLRGEWLWSEGPDNVESYLFFRGELTLYETPSQAELWIAARTSYHLYINGRYFARGPAPAIGGRPYLSHYDIGYCLEVGKNILAVLVHNTQVSRYIYERQPGGFWCQADIDTEPRFWTDTTWLVKPGACYHTNQARISPAEGFVEALDMREYPHSWMEPGFDSDGWQPAQGIGNIEDDAANLYLMPDFDPEIEMRPFSTVSRIGSVEPRCPATHISFARSNPGVSGVFAAETYVHVFDGDLHFQLYCDDPYRLIINGTEVKAQGKGTLENWSDPGWTSPRCFQQETMEPIDGIMTMVGGWNHVVFVQQVDMDSAGATILYPEADPDSLKFMRECDFLSLPGWNIAGPMRIPFHYITGTLELADLLRDTYWSVQPCDPAAHLRSLTFVAKDNPDQDGPPYILGQGDYIVLSLDRYARGCARLELLGRSGDIVDIVYAEEIHGDWLDPIQNNSRKIHSLTLDDQPCHWSSVAPSGMQHIMVCARQAEDEIVIEDAAIRTMTYGQRQVGGFNCSDELLNQIWEVGNNTLDATYDYAFLSSSAGRPCQMLADAMIQTCSSMLVFGNFDHTAKALREFAHAQFEDGSMPAMAPGGYTVRLDDFALLWPVWLQHYILHTDDRQLLEDMIPTLTRLLAFYENQTLEGLPLLGDLNTHDDLFYLVNYGSEGEMRGISTALNALYCHALVKADWLYSFIGQQEQAHTCRRHALQIVDSMQELTWNNEVGLFADYYLDGQPAQKFSMQSNVLAIFGGLAKAEHFDQIFNTMFVEYPPFFQDGFAPKPDSPFFKFFLLDTAMAMDYREWSIDYIRYYWGSMIENGATTWWQHFDPEAGTGTAEAGNLCHGSGVTPNYLLMREVAGIRPAKPGCTQIFFNPVISSVEWVQAQMPTPMGEIMVSWNIGEGGVLEASFSADFPLEVVPVLDPNVLGEAVFRVSDDVEILDPNS